jgi:superfamily II DNA or RNA helicase
MPESLLPGTSVEARGLQWEVVSSQQLGPQTLYRLRGLEGAVRGQELDLLAPFEAINPVRADLAPERPTTLRNWLVYHQAFLLEQALGPHTLLAVQPGRLRLEPYQLVPVMRALRMSRVRLLLADGVGLGKTIEAGLVITELMARRLAHRLLIVSPAGVLLEQWRTEMLERFGLRLQVIDRAKLEDLRRGQELGANPFDFIALGLVSIDFLKQDRILDTLQRSSYDIIVIDEAHHCFDLGMGQTREDSLRRRLACALARSCDAFLLLTATPHDGNDRSFASLCELLDPSLVDGKGALRGRRYREHVVRRLKRHLGDKFKTREVEPVPVEADDESHPRFAALQRGILEFVAPQLRSAFRARRYSDVLAFISLLKRSVSTVAACHQTLQTVLSRYEQIIQQAAEAQAERKQRLRTLRDYRRKLERFGTLDHEEEEEQSLLEAEQIAQEIKRGELTRRRERRAEARAASALESLADLCELAEAALDEDPKLQVVADQVCDIRAECPRANVLVYTEYTDSQDALVEQLKAEGVGEVMSLSGADDDKTRQKITERFRTRDNQVLVSTDASAEGLNLHQRCHHLLHVELPWNPNRLEQRNGRIDRYGQNEVPIVRYLYLRRTFEERILLRLIAKYERQRAKLTFVPNTLGAIASTNASEARLVKYMMDEPTRLFEEKDTLFDFEAPEEDDPEDPTVRELLEEVERSLQGFRQAAQTHEWLGDAGLNAEQSLVDEADQASKRGRSEAVSLASFVLNAVRLDGGTVAEEDGISVLTLPPDWRHGLDDMPGYNSDTRRMLLTTDIDVTSDADENPVGFLGQAHPLVRRALDRVRNISFGGQAEKGQDRRVSAVKGAVGEPQLLFTFLGRVSSEAGREFERVIALRMGKDGPVASYDAADEWLPFADTDLAISTRDVWQTHFAGWADADSEDACAAALDAFRPLAEDFLAERRTQLEAERQRQEEWLAQRCRDLVGEAREEPVEEPTLFDQPQAPRPRGDWAKPGDPLEHLACLGADRTVKTSLRNEADTVLRIHRERMAELGARLRLGDPEVIPLGLLMIVPEEEA